MNLKNNLYKSILCEFYETKDQNKLMKLCQDTYDWKAPVEKEGLRRNETCEICSRFVSLSHNTLQCIYCNVVFHISCCQEYYPKMNYENKDHWVCYYCQDSLQYDKQFHEKATATKNAYLKFIQSQIMIAKTWRMYHQYKEYGRMYTLIVKLQMRFRLKCRKKELLFSMQKKLRTIKLRINNIKGVLLADREGDSSIHFPVNLKEEERLKRKNFSLYYVVTVYDNPNEECSNQATCRQTWKIDSKIIPAEAFPNTCVDIMLDEKFILGGVNGFQTIIITLFQKSGISNCRDIFLGQTAVDLSRFYLWKSGGKFSEVTLEDYQYDIMDAVGLSPIKVDLHFFEHHFPSQVFEPSSNHHRFFEQQNIPPYLRKAMRRRINGMISFEVITTNSMNAECCHCYGSCIDELIRELGKIPDAKGFIIPNKKSLHVIPTNPTLNEIRRNSKESVKSSPSSRRNSPFSADSISHDVHPHHNHSDTTSMKKLWMSISDGKIYLFNHFGKPLKLILDLQYFNVTFDSHPSSHIHHDKKYANNFIYKLHRTGLPEFKFYPVHEIDIFRVKCAFITSLRCAKASLLTKNHENHHPHAIAEESPLHSSRSSLEDEREDSFHSNSSSRSSSFSIWSASPVHQHVIPAKERFNVNTLLNDLFALDLLTCSSSSTTTTPTVSDKKRKIKEAGTIMMLKVLLSESITHSSSTTATAVPSSLSLVANSSLIPPLPNGSKRTRPTWMCEERDSQDSGLFSRPTTRRTIQLAPL